MPQKQRVPPPSRRGRDITQPVPLPYDATTVSPHERDVARFQSEDARTGAQTDEVPPTVRMMKLPEKIGKRSFKHTRLPKKSR